MKQKIMYWLLAHFPRPVAVLYAILVQILLDDPFDHILLIGCLLSATIIFTPIGIATTGVVAFGSYAVAAGAAALLSAIILSALGRTAVAHYNNFSEALPKREKKQGRGDLNAED
jgi:hypothetical protein